MERARSLCITLLASIALLLPTEARADGCRPVVHGSTRPLSRTYYEQYRLIGGSPDGKRVAVVRGNIGPGAGIPILSLWVYEAGNPIAAYVRSYFFRDGTAPRIPQLMTTVAKEHGADLTASAVTVGRYAPTPIAWCADAAGRIHTADGRTFELRVSHDACPKDPSRRALSWKLCAAAGGCIVQPPTTSCLEGRAALLDLYRAGKYTWAVVDELTEPTMDVSIHAQGIAGGTP